MKAKQHEEKAAAIKARLTRIEEKHPELDFNKSVSYIRDLELYSTLKIGYKVALSDVRACKSKRREYRCDGCDCWKNSYMAI